MLPHIPCRYLDLFGTLIPAWGLWQILGIIVFSVLAYFEARRMRLAKRHILAILALTIVFGFIGMRLFFCLVHDQWNMLFSPEGGFDSAGGFLGIIAALIYLRAGRLSIGRYLDTYAFPGAVLLIIGRIGCYCALCEKGTSTTLPWAMQYAGATRHPIALYYILSGMILTALFYFVRKRRWANGILISAFVALYSLSRVVLDFLREEPPHSFFGMSAHQVAYMLIFIVALVFVARVNSIKPLPGTKRKSF